MDNKSGQQIIVSGLGGQGVLFITRLLADAALKKEFSVLISETHGMAQRGGNVISHLKVKPGGGDSTLVSPLIRPGRADILLALHQEAVQVHGHFLSPEGTAIINSPEKRPGSLTVNADMLARALGSPVSANLALLGFAAALGKLFCSPDEIEGAIKAHGGKRVEVSLHVFRAGRVAAEASVTP